MANDAFRSSILADLLAQAGVPFTSIQVVDIAPTPPVVNIVYPPEATAEQIALGNQMRDEFDWRRRRALSRAVVVTAMNALTAGQRAIIDRAMIADFLRTNPRLAAAISAASGIPLVVDEIDPN